LRPGDFVTVTITEPELRGVAMVPTTAIGSGNSALVLDANNRLEEVPVEVLRRQGDDTIIRARELNGRQIVAERSPLLGAGISVEPVDPNAAAVVPEPPAMIALDADRRARLIAFVEGSQMPPPAKTRVLGQLEQDEVPADVVERLEARMGT